MEPPSDQDDTGPFGSACRKDVGAILGLKDDPRFPDFWEKISASGKVKRRALQMSPSAFAISPFDMSATQRITWLKRNVLHPVERLESALANENAPHFVHWEDQLREPQDGIVPVDCVELLSGLAALKVQAINVISKLECDLGMKVQTTDEIRFTIVYDAIWDLHDFFPEFPLSRGNWDPEHKQVGILPDYVRRVFLETTGDHEQLDGPIQLALQDVRRSQRKST
ncbi:hypothetical protein [Ruegeria pomeroyi]|uniref:Uncharacterized protein n=1 Tax=Ruegeria pomeroyi TaxID=89184 RepID=A0A850LBZ7_9RHOB|nr:hypothetical protein [Ruegeria pomeroyi]NVK95626.1 hypothetical protein [Ruegeria pomeroyi]NVL03025.1 hypothetical protein [Ruegeria pomeroyi]